MFKYKHGLLPDCFNDMFPLAASIHSHGTRATLKGDFHVKYSRTSLHKNSLIQQGILYWNSLHTDLKQPATIGTFSSKLKQYLLDTYLSSH